ncbi:MAG: GNAT family N-acetyltransferase, partial [Chloroflexales bacterium]|nr:GNAT family N-acetyltransferase [Chloroflexales bacterium]
SLFAPFRAAAQGRFFAAGPAQIDELDRIYRGALRGRFGPLVRDAAWWEREVLHDWERRPWQAYIWRDEHGVGRSYTIFRLEPDGDGRRFEAREMVALDPTARAQLFVFVAAHQDQVTSARFRAPADAPVNLLFPDPLECAIQPHFMLRLLDVPAALEGYAFPREVAGRLTMAVADDWISDNQGVFALAFEGGRCQVTRLAADAPTDLRCDVRVLTQIYSRYLRPRTAAAFGMLAAPVREALTLAERAFTGLVPFSSDFF